MDTRRQKRKQNGSLNNSRPKIAKIEQTINMLKNRSEANRIQNTSVNACQVTDGLDEIAGVCLDDEELSLLNMLGGEEQHEGGFEENEMGVCNEDELGYEVAGYGEEIVENNVGNSFQYNGTEYNENDEQFQEANADTSKKLI